MPYSKVGLHHELNLPHPPAYWPINTRSVVNARPFTFLARYYTTRCCAVQRRRYYSLTAYRVKDAQVITRCRIGDQGLENNGGTVLDACPMSWRDEIRILRANDTGSLKNRVVS